MLTTAEQRVDSAPKPEHGPVAIHSRDVAEAAVAAILLDLYSRHQIVYIGPEIVSKDMNISYPGVQDWLGRDWTLQELAKSAWTLAMEATGEYEFHETTGGQT